MEVTPEELIRDFTVNLDCGSWERDGRDMAKQHLINYAIECGHGQRYYAVDDIIQMFKEMKAFNNFQVETCRNELNHWQGLALANDESAYDEAYLRENLMDFIEALLKLVEAFWPNQATEYL